MFGDVVFLGEERPDATELEDAFAAVEDGKLIHTGKLFATMSSDEFKKGQKITLLIIEEGIFTISLGVL